MEAAPEVIAARYRIGAVLGRGGMGEVREAQDQRLGRAVAIKLLQPSMAADDGARRRFEDEARAAAQLVHPNAVAVFDTGEHEGTPYIVMECLPGRTLADEIAEGPLPTARVRAVALQVLGALEAAHQAGIVHRDIKPGNILLTVDGTAKVGDFGIAKTAEGLDHTATGMIVGTPSYLAPERITGAPATARSDLYATGVVLYEALTGSKPFADRSPLATAAAIQHEAPLPLAEVLPGADPSLVSAVERAMAKDPADRYESAAAMAAAVRGEAAAGSGPAAEQLVGPAATTTTVLPVEVTTAAPAVTGVSTRTAAATSADLPEAARRRRLPPLALAGLALAVLLVVVVLLAGGGGGGDTTSGDTPPGSPLPPELEERVRALEEAVEP